MTEKTFRDMLPLTDGQREFLGDNNNNVRCSRCFLSANRVGNTLCGDFVRGKMWVDFICSDVRAEALRLDDEYRKANMKKDILSLREYEMRMRNICVGLGGKTLDTEKIALHNAALTDKIAEIESRLAEYEDETETKYTWIEASEKCKQKAVDLAKNGNPAIFEVEQNCFVLTTSDERFEFPYAEPREPQPGDFMINGSGNAFTFSHYCCDDDGCSFDIDGGTHDNIKPTGYRVNENGDVVKIKRGDK